MLIATFSRSDLMSGNLENVKVESYPSPDDVPIIPAISKILVDWITKENLAKESEVKT